MYKIAIVDDDADIRRVLELRLRMAGFSVLTAGDGEAGLRLIRAEKPKVVVLDSIMPKMNGSAVCQAIRTDTDLHGTFIIFVSGSGFPEEFQNAREISPNLFMTKPYNLEQLVKTIRTALA